MKLSIFEIQWECTKDGRWTTTVLSDTAEDAILSITEITEKPINVISVSKINDVNIISKKFTNFILDSNVTSDVPDTVENVKVKTVNNDQPRTIACPHCNFMAKTETGLKIHIKNVHRDKVDV